MPVINFIKPDGSTHQIEVASGTTIMEAGRDHNMGLEGTCGGSLSCATCHVILDEASFARVGGPSEDEMDMLDLAFGVADTSRLGCQIEITDDLDGLNVRVPDEM
jgi:ferredoxin